MNTRDALTFYARHGGNAMVISSTAAALDLLEQGGHLRAYTYPFGGEVKSVSHRLESLDNLDAMAHLMALPIYVEVIGKTVYDDLLFEDVTPGAYLGQILPDGIILGGVLELLMVIGL